jgi:dTDP-4-amino-4,6-dideoxygalactose transaminase
MLKKIIPRVRVNYSIFEIYYSFLVFLKKSSSWKDKTISFLSDYTGQKNLMLTPSGRAGLYFILKNLSQQRVIIPAYTCKAVVEATLFAGKTIEFLDSCSESYNIDIQKLKEMDLNGSILILTHQYGFASDAEVILEVCKNKNVFIIEDMAAALGGSLNTRLLGSFGDAAFYSFDSTKLINVPLKSGFITVKNHLLFSKIKDDYFRLIQEMPTGHSLKLLILGVIYKLISNSYVYNLFYLIYFKSQRRYTNESPELERVKDDFYKYDTSNWQAFLAFRQLSQIDEIIKRRHFLWNRYWAKLSQCRSFKCLQLKDNYSSCIRFPILVEVDKFEFFKRGISRGIDFGFSFTYLGCGQIFSDANLKANRVLLLPFYFNLTNAEVEYICDNLISIDKEFIL